MSQESRVFQGEQVTFRGLFDHYRIVEIPIIQRDYAQGRKSATEVRTEFLNAICRTLEEIDGENTDSLDLDFVYGRVDCSKQNKFFPLDGQQRLTTLFLLHWYCAWKDGKWDNFTAFIKDGSKSRFTYSVRSSSEEFFDFLVNLTPPTIPNNSLKLSAIITDRSQFYSSWKLDPTIQSALEMLDAIDGKFAQKKGFYDRLVRAEHPRITFQLLNLKRFDLSDELYIKMNARGKALTTFETFKARLEQKLESYFPDEKKTLNGRQVSVKAYFCHQIDTVWADLFWNYRDPKTRLFDEQVMNLLRALVISTRNPDNIKANNVYDQLIAKKQSFTFFKYEEHGCLDRELVKVLISVLDIWGGGKGEIKSYLRDTLYYDEKSIFRKVISNTPGKEATYKDLIQFHAYCSYLHKNQDNLRADDFWEWMRVIKNLAENTYYGGIDDFARSIRSVNELLNYSTEVLNHISKESVKVTGFDGQQIREEKLKAQLIQKSKEWRNLILKAEQHGYFNGQIEFLFKMSEVLDRWLGKGSIEWAVEEDKTYRQAFSDYFAKASAIFSNTGLNIIGENRLERALLAIGDYLLRTGSCGNYSFLDNSHRDLSWKRLLQGGTKPDDFVEERRHFIKDLFNQIDLKTGILESLESIIRRGTPMPEWRRLIVQNPEFIDFCGGRVIRYISDNCVYLLRGVRMSGAHAELFTYHLYRGFLQEKHKNGDLTPFSKPEYYEPHTDTEEPCAYLECKYNDETIVLDIYNYNGNYELKFFCRNNSALPDKLKNAMKTRAGFSAEEGNRISRVVDKCKIQEAISEVVKTLGNFTNTPLS